MGRIDTGGDAVFDSPQDGLVEVVGLVHILEGIDGSLRLGGTGSTPQEGHDLGPATGSGGTKVRCIQTGGNVILHGPHDAVVEEVVLVHVHEGILSGSLLHLAAAGADAVNEVVAQRGNIDSLAGDFLAALGAVDHGVVGAGLGAGCIDVVLDHGLSGGMLVDRGLLAVACTNTR